MSDRGNKLYLQDILTAIERIADYVTGVSREQFIDDQKTVDAVVRNLEIIGEAARNISEDFTLVHTGVPWHEMVSMRNKVVHEYFGVDTDILWQTITHDLPGLELQIKKLV